MGRHRRRWNILQNSRVVWGGLDVTDWQSGLFTGFCECGDEGLIHQKKRRELFQTDKLKCCMTTDFQKLCSVCYGGISVERKITGWAFVVSFIVCILRLAGAWRSVGKGKIRNTRTPTLLVTNTVREPTVSSVLGTEREMTSDVRRRQTTSTHTVCVFNRLF
jgi:hypothetical protein